jgi:hypothetical protein
MMLPADETMGIVPCHARFKACANRNNENTGKMNGRHNEIISSRLTVFPAKKIETNYGIQV